MPPAGHSGSGMITRPYRHRRLRVAGVSLILPAIIDPGEPSRPGPTRPGRSSSGALHLDPWGQAASLTGWSTADGMISRTGARRSASKYQFRAGRCTRVLPANWLILLPSGDPHVALGRPSSASAPTSPCAGSPCCSSASPRPPPASPGPRSPTSSICSPSAPSPAGRNVPADRRAHQDPARPARQAHDRAPEEDHRGHPRKPLTSSDTTD
jgi:hypothetical protein